MVICPDTNSVIQTSWYLKATFILRAARNAEQSSVEYRCSTGYKTHPLRQRTTRHMIFRDSVLQQVVPGWTAAVCCCLPALGRSTLPRVVWRAVSVCVTTEKQKVSEHTQMLCSTLSLWTHTYLLQTLCNTNQLKEASQTDVEGINCDSPADITPAQTDRQTTSSWKYLTPNPSYVLWILHGLQWHQLSIETHVTGRWLWNVLWLLVIPTTL